MRNIFKNDKLLNENWNNVLEYSAADILGEIELCIS